MTQMNLFFLEWDILDLNSVSMNMGLLLDGTSLVFLSVVCLISSMIVKYSKYYMMGDLNYVRFILVLSSFVLSMWFLIISPNMISLLLGWDGLGLTSYVLVIYYQNESSCNAGMLTVLSNRIGDVAILLCISMMFLYGSWNFIYHLNSELMIIMFVILACMTKSAQVPFSAWLPAAMAAPTPVSALVHSSTLVTAGVYLLVRFNNLIIYLNMSMILMFVGVLTMVMSGMVANFETDMKKIVALSTLSQLGLMFVVLGLGMSDLVFFHLIIHALFKSSLFMCSGFMIHSVKSEQDSRSMSGFFSSSPVLGLFLSVSNMSLCGFPFLAGFYSKDMSLETSFFLSTNLFFYFLMIVGTGLTVSYSIRLLYKGVSSMSSLSLVNGNNDLSMYLVRSMLGLIFMSCVSGFFMFWIFYLFSYISVLSSVSKYSVIFIILLSSLIMFFVSESMSYKALYLSFKYSMILNCLSLMFFLPNLSTKLFSLEVLKFGGVMDKVSNMGWLEYYGGQGIMMLFKSMSFTQQKGQLSLFTLKYMVISMFFMIVVFFV